MKYEEQWTCRVCKTEKVIPAFARDCERSHGVDPKGLDGQERMSPLCSGVGTPEGVETAVSG